MLYFRNTPIGEIGIAEQDGFITHLYFSIFTSFQNEEIIETPLIKNAFDQLEGYFNGELEEFSLPLRPVGTPFMKNVWQKVCEVSYGQTASYKDIARAVGNPGAARAVGQANNKNPIPIFIPCHRIIGSNGKLVGYGAGLNIKQKLLDFEAGNIIR